MKHEQRSTSKSEKIYNYILSFYPKSYRREFGEEMKFVFSESLKDAKAKDGEGIINFWIKNIIDSGKNIVKENLENSKGGENLKNKKITRPLFVTLGFLLVTFFGSLMVDGWDWEMFDFMLMGFLIFGTGMLVEFANYKLKNKNQRIIAVALIVFILIIIWVQLAVGIIDTLPFAGN